MFSIMRRLKRSSELKKNRAKILASGLFDENYYAESNPDVVESGQDLLTHFLLYGGREGRSPSRQFNILAYLGANPGVRQSGVNPLLDWLEAGPSNERIAPPDPDRRQNDGDSIGLASELTGPETLKPEILATIRESGLFDVDYYLSTYPDIRAVRVDPLQHYVAHGAEELRNPSAEFDNYFYVTRYVLGIAASVNEGGGLYHYLRHGKALGYLPRPANSITLDATDVPVRDTKPRIAIQIHLFYPEMIEILCAYLRDLTFDFDLFISTCSPADQAFAQAYLTRIKLGKGETVVKLVPNRGRDIAPLLVEFKEIWADYDYICHLHTKRSPHAPFGQRWMAWILGHLFGSSDLVEKAIDYLEAHPDCGMLFPDNFIDIKRFCHWGGNESRARAFMARLGFPSVELPAFPQFAAGSMAWFRTRAFSALATARLTLDDFEPENGQVEGTLAHMLERALPLVAQYAGYNLTTFYLRRLPSEKPFFALHGRGDERDPIGRRWKRDDPAIALNRSRPLAPISPLFNEKALEISWILPDFGLGHGGHMTMFRMMEKLEESGHRQTLWIQNPVFDRRPQESKAFIQKHYRKIGERVAVRFLPDDIRQLSGDIVIATDCWTVFPAAAATNFKERFYFIQDFEPYFHPHGENYLIAEITYKMGFAALCAGDWLLHKAQSYGMWSRSWNLCSDPEHYFAGAPRLNREATVDSQAPKPFRIVFYSRSSTPRRAVNLGLAAFEELARRRSDFSVLMFGEEPVQRNLSFHHTEMGVMTPQKVGEMYRLSAIGVSFSTTNYSLVPLEMMACGLPVVEIDSESARTAFPSGTVSFAAPSPIAVADAVERLMDDPEVRAAQISRGRTFVDRLDWADSAKRIESALIERLKESGYRTIDPEIVAAPLVKAKRKASVIIPTYNGGALFREVLQRVASQECDFPYEILVVDSSSTDDTAQFAADLGDRVRLHVIPQTSFQHGRTRNLAISMTEGDIVAVLTQDATPANASWLQKLAEGFDRDRNVAGVFGRHRAYDAHNSLTARDLDWMFDRFQDLGPVFNLDRGLPSFVRRGGFDWRMIMHFYSDNNSAMRRSVWKELPYPEIDWGEDQVWAWEALKLGFSKAYANEAVVYHSHDFKGAQQVRAAVSEGRMFAECFGYDLHPQGVIEAELAEIERRERRYATEHGLSQDNVDSYVRTMRASIEGRSAGATGIGS